MVNAPHNLTQSLTRNSVINVTDHQGAGGFNSSLVLDQLRSKSRSKNRRNISLLTGQTVLNPSVPNSKTHFELVQVQKVVSNQAALFISREQQFNSNMFAEKPYAYTYRNKSVAPGGVAALQC